MPWSYRDMAMVDFNAMVLPVQRWHHQKIVVQMANPGILTKGRGELRQAGDQQ